MFKIQSDGTITINQGDAFNLACLLDKKIDFNEEKLDFIIKNSEGVILTVSAKELENGVFFIIDSEKSLSLFPKNYEYFVKYTASDNNSLIVTEGKIIVRGSDI